MFEIVPFLDAIKDLFFLVGYVSNYNLFPEPLSPEDEKIYLEKYNNGDENAKKVLIERNLRLVAHIAKKYAGSATDQEDIISIGTIGLIKAVNSYKGNKGVRLATYAARCIENEILMHFRATKKIQQEVSLNEAIGQDKEGNTITFIDVIENDSISIDEQIDLKIKVKKLYEKIGKVLKDREKTIIELRFGLNGYEPKTQNEVAKLLGISRSYVSRIETKAIGKLSKEIKD
ncbi:MAG: RNA polymerase sporulation sigma factor SigK [Clostridia bacterium]|nr:RNA polymerase sporulation sigma factor SigK [Clostridia bacterium]